MRRISKAFSRLLVHLTRTKARVAWVLIGACALFYWLVPDETVRQMSLVLASVAGAAIFLPELSSDLWTMKADEIRRTVPENQIADLQKELIAASSGPSTWSSNFWSEGLAPLLGAIRTPLQAQWGLSYDIHVYLDQVVKLESGPVRIHRLDTTARSERLFPNDGDTRIWVSMARTFDALMGEYGGAGCLLREQVNLPGLSPERWREEMLNLCRVQVSINGRGVPLEVVAPNNLDLVRWEGVLPEDGALDGPVPATVIASFPLSAEEEAFSVIFASYYCVGKTEVQFSVYHPNGSVSLDLVNFCTRRPGGERPHELIYRTSDDKSKVIATYSTGRNSILTPGSGLHFSWKTSDRP